MPFFLDRHDLRLVTAEAVAAAHQQDLEVQARHACKALTYWFDEERQTAFCLIEAPTEAAVRALHHDAHGLIPTMITEVQSDTVANFLGRVMDPPDALNNPIREAGFRALMFVDMVNSTQITSSLGDVKAQAILAKHREVVRQALLANEGREIDRAGDGCLTCFMSAARAVTCAVAIQRELRRLNANGVLPVEVQVRIGLGAGEPLADGDALFGSTINLTARICAAADPGQILAARVVRELCGGKTFCFRDFGERQLKGIPDPVEVYEVDWAD